MGLRAKFNLVILVAFAVGFAAAAVVLHRVFIDHAREQVMQNARIMMTAANAIRTYTAKDLGPLLPMEHDGKFVAETVPAFAAQKNFKDVQAAFAGYTYREPALNPTNLSDRAQDWEADIIGLFRNEAHAEGTGGRTRHLARADTQSGAPGFGRGAVSDLPQHGVGGAGGIDPDLTGSSTIRSRHRSSRFPWRCR